MIDLESPGSLKLLAETIHADIDLWSIDKFNDGPRSHLGASQIGKPCPRHLWYNFRWITHKVFSGRMYRLFQRGHREEAYINEFLEGIGCIVTLFDDDNLHEKDKGKRQIRINDHEGHFGGSIDGKLQLPERYAIKQDVIFLSEFKTKSTSKFAKLQLNGVQLEEHEHFCQMSVYAHKLGLQYALYLSVNKNNDDLHVEIVKLDPYLGQEMLDKAGRIIWSQTPPNKISASPTFFECKWCDSNETCWNNGPVLRNCRSCESCKPIANAQWECARYGIIPKEFIRNGCVQWESLV